MTEEKIEKEFEFKILEASKFDASIPKEIFSKLQKGDMLLRATSLTTDFLPEKWLNELAIDSINNRVDWRHKDPEVGGRFYGRNIYNQVIDGTGKNEGKKVIDSFYRIFGGPEGSYNDKMQRYIKLQDEHGHPVGISKSFIVNRCPKNGEINRVFALEDSITYIPQCKTCKISEVYKMEGNDLENKEKEIKKLQDDLNSARLQLEEKDSAFDEMKAKVEKLESGIKEKEDEKKSLEDRVVELSDNIKKLEAKMIAKEREPYIKRLEELESDKYLFSIIKERPIEEIDARIKKLEADKTGPKVTTTTIDDEARNSLEEGSDKKSIGVGAFRNNPKLAKEIANMKKLDKELGIDKVW